MGESQGSVAAGAADQDDVVDAVFTALGDVVRRRIVQLLASAGGEVGVGAIVEHLNSVAPISQPSVSQHLKLLREAGLLTVRKEGNRSLNTLNRQGVRAAQTWLTAL